MLGGQTQLRLCNYLKAVADAEISIEVSRTVLAEKKEFEPHTAFRRIDKLNRGYITVGDMIEFLEEMELTPLESQVRNFFILYDTDNDYKLSYDDFKNAVLPASNLSLRELATNRGSYSDQPLSYAASWAMARVFEKEIQSFKQLDIKREAVVDQLDWDINTAFNTIDEERFGYIDAEAIGAFFKRLEERIAPNEIDALLRRGDKDADGKLDFTEFMRLLQPIDSYDRKVSLSPEKRSPTKVTSGLEATPSKISVRNITPIRIGSPPRTSSPRTLSSKKREASPSDADYNRYLRESYQMQLERRGELSPKRSSRRGSRRSSQRSSPRNSRSPRSRSPSLRQEPTDYRVDIGYRTVKTYDTPTRVSRSGAESMGQQSETQTPARRSRSPKLRSELTDYRVENNYRTVKAYDESARQSVASESRSTRNGVSSVERPTRTSKSPKLREEPTNYREGTGYRTVRAYENAPFQASAGRTQHKEPESEIKRPEEEQTESKKDPVEISKRLEFVQREAKPEKPERLNDFGTPARRNPEEVKSTEATFKKGDHIDVTESKYFSPNKTGDFNSTSQRKSPLKSYEEQYLAKAMNQVAILDKKLENMKNQLALCEDFTVMNAYKRIIDSSGQGVGSKAQFEESTKKLGIFLTQSELDAVFKRFDADSDGNVSLHEFEHAITPVAREYAKKLKLRVEENPLTRSTLQQLIEFIKTLGEVESAVEDLRLRLSKRVSLDSAFKALDTREKGHIGVDEMKKMLMNYGIYPESRDLETLKNRIDLNEDGVVSSEEFTKTMTPSK